MWEKDGGTDEIILLLHIVTAGNRDAINSRHQGQPGRRRLKKRRRPTERESC